MSQSLVNRNNLPLCDTLAALYLHVKKNAVGDPLCFSDRGQRRRRVWLAAAAVFVYLLGFDGCRPTSLCTARSSPTTARRPSGAATRAASRKCAGRAGAAARSGCGTDVDVATRCLYYLRFSDPS